MNGRRPNERIRISGMAELSRFEGITVWMKPEAKRSSHSPHFHAEYRGEEVSYEIGTWKRLAGDLRSPNKERILLEWAKDHEDELRENWRLLAGGGRVIKIEPYERRRGPRRRASSHPPLYDVVDFEIVGPGTLWILFDDCTEKTIDFRPIMIGEVFGEWRDPCVFNGVQLDHGDLVWPNNADFDNADLHDWDAAIEADFAERFRRGVWLTGR